MIKLHKLLAVALASIALAGVAMLACTSEKIVVQTVEVQVDREIRVVETVVVEKETIVEGETVVQTVIVEREKVVEGQTVVETVVVEKEVVVQQEVAVEVEKVVTATAQPTATPPPASGTEGLRDVARDRTLVIAIGGQQLQPANMNLLSGGGLSRIRTFSNNSWLEFLFYFGHHDGKVRPWLAKDWQYNDTNDEITITLRDDAYWSDGTPFTC